MPEGTKSDNNSYVNKWMRRLKEQRKPFDLVNEYARKVYGSETTYKLSKRAPSPHYNAYKVAVISTRAQLIEGEPRVTVRAANPRADALANFLQPGMSAIFTSRSFANVLQAVVSDVIMCGGGYLKFVDSAMHHLYWFDAWADSVLATAKSLWDGRAFLVRNLLDEEEFKDLYAKELESVGYKLGGKDEKRLPNAKDVEGRDSVGLSFDSIHPDAGVQLKESSTSTLVDAYGNAIRSSTTEDSRMDGIVEVYRLYVPSGDKWVYYEMFDQQVLSDEPIEVVGVVPEPGIIHFPADYLGGQFYQPTLFVDMIRSQDSYNWMDAKALQILSMLDFPAFRAAAADKTNLTKFNNTNGEMLFLNEPGAFAPIEQQQISGDHFTQKEFLQDNMERVSGVHDIIQGKEPDEASSGVALRRLEQNARNRFVSLMSSRDEFMRDVGRHVAARLVFEAQQSGEAPQEIASIDPASVWNDTVFEFHVVPPTERGEKMMQFTEALMAFTPLFPQDFTGAVKMAGVVTGYRDIADEMTGAYAEHLQKAVQAQEQVQGAPAGPAQASMDDQQAAADATGITPGDREQGVEERIAAREGM